MQGLAADRHRAGYALAEVEPDLFDLREVRRLGEDLVAITIEQVERAAVGAEALHHLVDDGGQNGVEVDAALDETGIVIANIEALRGWASPDHATDVCLAHEAIVWEMADRFTCRYLQVIGDYTGTVAEAGVGFGALCDRGADHGMLVGLEAVPSMTNIGTYALASEIVS